MMPISICPIWLSTEAHKNEGLPKSKWVDRTAEKLNVISGKWDHQLLTKCFELSSFAINWDLSRRTLNISDGIRIGWLYMVELTMRESSIDVCGVKAEIGALVSARGSHQKQPFLASRLCNLCVDHAQVAETTISDLLAYDHYTMQLKASRMSTPLLINFWAK